MKYSAFCFEVTVHQISAESVLFKNIQIEFISSELLQFSSDYFEVTVL